MFRRLFIGCVFVLLSAAGVAHAADKATAPQSATAVLQVENMTCGACPITVRKALQKVPGVANAKVDLESQTATVKFDPSKTNVEALTAATGAAGYPSKVKQ